MTEKNAAESYLERVTERLKAAGYDCLTDVTHNDQIFACAAKRTRFELTKFRFSETFFTFAEFPALTVDGLRAYSSQSFEYALRSRSIPLPRGFFESVFCFPVALVADVATATSDAVRNNAPTRHWGSAEVPVVYDLNSGTLHYFEKTPIWGAAYYAGIRKTIEQMLS